MGPEIGTCIGIDASVVWMSSSLHQVGLRVSRDLAAMHSNTYSQANNGYGNITPKHKNKQCKNILRAATRS
jgi:hypothetical protein